MGRASLHFIAVELQAKAIRAARYTREGAPEARLTLPLQGHEASTFILQRLRSAILPVWPPPPHAVAGISLSTVAPFDYRRGLLLSSAGGGAEEPLPLRDFLISAFHVPVFVGNTIDLGALAEYRFGAGQGAENLVYIHVDEALGGGFLIEGQLFTGGNGLGGTVAHMIMEANGPRCACGNRGCLRLYASGSALLQGAEGPAWPDLNALLTAARQGEGVAQARLTRAGFYLGVAVVELMYLFNPQRFVFGGRLMQAGELILAPLRETVIERAPALYREGVLIQRAALDEERGLLGALAYLLHELRIKPPVL